ncbi:hypothetical protein L3X38_012121 [Prunus dulcis]|uniref:Reverse transcriptase zinc-binding domain-containing protein n=1 Tax=Prunus dulcis TaxID=3755 RepID=A0AAD4ZFS5_PRUDU|nr:hypothetical protein L3X38_012121 [Prunus dulcis]
MPSMVKELIDPVAKRWLKEDIACLFDHAEAKILASLPLSRKGTRELSNTEAHTALWKSIWHLNVSPKLQSFVWRVCEGAMFDRQNLQQKHINIDDTCGVCGSEGESVMHLFFKCEFARAFWFASSLQLDTRKLRSATFDGCWTELMHLYGQDEHADLVLQWIAYGL